MPFSYIKKYGKKFSVDTICLSELIWAANGHECLMPTHSTYQKLENAE